MKKRFIYGSVLIICISFFSFKEIGQCNVKATLKKDLPQKIVPVTMGEDLNLSPFYNFLKI